MRGSLQVRIRVYNKGDDDESERNNVVSSHVLNLKSEKILLVERPNSYVVFESVTFITYRFLLMHSIARSRDE